MLQPMGSACYWQDTSIHVPRPGVTGHDDFDLAIVGGGYTGLWTAYHLLESEPSMRIAVIERETIGFGASGRNGGFAMTLLDLSLSHLRRNHGDEAAKAAHEAVALSVEEIGQTIAEKQIDCEWRHGGLMVVATNPGQLKRVRADLAAAAALDLGGFIELTAEEAQAEAHSPTYIGGLREEHCGVVHPAKLARGLANVVEEMGARIFEGSRVTGIEESRGGLRLQLPQGSIQAAQVVLATNAWACETPWFKRKIQPLYTYIALTEPLSDEQWASVGWESHCGIEDKRNFVHYYRRTADGRILWGGSDGITPYGGRIGPRHDRHDGVLNRLRGTFRQTFPQLEQVRFTHHWGGPVDLTVLFVPIFGTLCEGRLHYGLGYNGHGVAPSHMGGKILRDRVLERETPLTELCFVDSEEVAFPPEPIAWLGGQLTRRSLLRQDSDLERNRGGGEMEPLMMRILKKLG
ncbi:MAG: FAD-binding oxidoreductase [Solirubrobacterales bacterium]